MAVAQNATPDALAAARTSALQAEKSWFALAPGLDAKLAPLLPCDPAARKSIQDVGRASDARASALMNYLRLTAAQAAEHTAGARRMLASGEARAADSAGERTDATAERGAIDNQATKLAAGAKARPELAGARDTLGQIDAGVARRATLADQNAAARDRANLALRDLVAADQARETALKQEVDAFQAEEARWSAYYAARLSRAQAECSAIGGGAPEAPAGARAKGKKQGAGQP
jgi:hypothetical protein